MDFFSYFPSASSLSKLSEPRGLTRRAHFALPLYSLLRQCLRLDLRLDLLVRLAPGLNGLLQLATRGRFARRLCAPLCHGVGREMDAQKTDIIEDGLASERAPSLALGRRFPAARSDLKLKLCLERTPSRSAPDDTRTNCPTSRVYFTFVTYTSLKPTLSWRKYKDYIYLCVCICGGREGYQLQYQNVYHYQNSDEGEIEHCAIHILSRYIERRTARSSTS